MNDPRLEITEHFVRAQARHISERAKLITAERGGFEPLFLVVCKRSPLDGTPLDTDTACVPVQHGGGTDEQFKMETLFAARAIAIAGDAVACVVCINSWGVFAQGEKGRQLFEQAQRGELDVAKHEDRVETIFTIIEWASGSLERVAALRVTRDQGFVDFDDISEEQLGNVIEMNNGFKILPPQSDPPPPGVVEQARSFAKNCIRDMRQVMKAHAERGTVARG